MQINWFTVVAQIINFLVLVWLLKRYLYRPVLDAIDEREKKIAAQLNDAELKKTEATKEQDEFKQKNELFDNQKNELMNKAVSETDEARKKLLEEARLEANELRSKLASAWTAEQEKQNNEIAQKIQQEVFAVTRKTLADLASMSLEAQSVNIFIKRLKALNEDEKKQFISAFKSVSNKVMVRSAFDLSATLQAEIQQAVAEILGANTQLEFITAPHLISGIELTTNGYKLAWSIAEYLQSFEKNISSAVNAEPKIIDENKKLEPEVK